MTAQKKIEDRGSDYQQRPHTTTDSTPSSSIVTATMSPTCIAMTKKGKGPQCSRDAANGCGGRCTQHFKELQATPAGQAAVQPKAAVHQYQHQHQTHVAKEVSELQTQVALLQKQVKNLERVATTAAPAARVTARVTQPSSKPASVDKERGQCHGIRADGTRCPCKVAEGKRLYCNRKHALTKS